MCHHILESAALYAWMSGVSDDDSVYYLVDAPVDPSKHLLLLLSYRISSSQSLSRHTFERYPTGHVLRLPNPAQNRRSTRAGSGVGTESRITRSTRPVTPSVCNPKPQVDRVSSAE
jgi:hypothetical protein